MKLDNHQEIIFKEMVKNPRYAAFLPTGCGKTLLTLEVIKSLNLDRVLIIAPKLVIKNAWFSEIKKWNYGFKIHELRGKGLKIIDWDANIFITTPESILSKLFLPAIFKIKPIALIIDESSKFKNRSSKRTKTMMKICRNFDFTYLLSATPAPRSLENLWPQFYLIDYGERLNKTLTKYREEHFYQIPPMEYNKWKLREGHEKIIYKKIEDKAKSVIVNYQMQCKYNDIYIDPSKLILQKINEIKAGVFKLDNLDFLLVKNISNKLLQASGGAIYDDKKNIINICDTKIKYVLDFLENQQGASVLIACNFTSEIIRLKNSLKKYTVRIIKGSMNEKSIQTTIEQWNKKEIDVLLCHPAAMGHGLNLQYGGNIIVWFSPPMDLELYQQLNGRLNRRGQEDQVIVHHLIMNKTIDKLYFERLKNKSDLQSSLLEFLKK